MNTPRIVFCTTCKGRAQHIKQTLPQNLADNADYPNASFVVLDYDSPDDLMGYLSEHRPVIKSGRLAVFSYLAGGPFRMAHAKNMAHRLGILDGADILVNLDADNFTGQGFATYIAEQFAADPNCFLWAQMIKGVLPRGIHGRIAVSTHAYLNAGGYDEKFDCWGPDDKDFNGRLRRLGYAAVSIDQQFLLRGINHTDRMRFKDYPHAAVPGAEDRFDLSGAANTISNFGHFGEGTVYRRFVTTVPIKLDSVPTRIFGIGMHKTATTSLHMALTKLGFDSAHWKNAHWAKTIWKEMTFGLRSPTLEKNYALCDLPITILFRQLDAAYPGSKFILTRKDEAKWLHDVRDHWGYETNRFRKGWDSDPFTHRLHNLVYGQKHFDAEVFLNRYRAHNAEVLEYFKERPNDLLVMDMDQGAGWADLCSFFKTPVPLGPYPRIESTRFEPIEDIIKWL